MASTKDTIILTYSGRNIHSELKDIPLYQAVVTRIKILQPKNLHLQDILDSFQAAINFGGFGMSIEINSKNLFEALAISKSTGSFPDLSKFKDEKSSLTETKKSKSTVSSTGVLKMIASSVPSKPTTVRIGLIPTSPSMVATEFVMWFDIIPKLAEGKLIDVFIKECRLNNIQFNAHDNVPLPKIMYENFMKDKKNKNQYFSFLQSMS